MMQIPASIVDFLQRSSSLSLGFQEINVVNVADLEDWQVGYSIHPDGHSLVTGNSGDWKAQWLVIASDDLGDPIFLDLSLPLYPVFTAMHGTGSWVPYIIADSLVGFEHILSTLSQIAIDRSSPAELENNPIDRSLKEKILKDIDRQNPTAGAGFWEVFLGD